MTGPAERYPESKLGSGGELDFGSPANNPCLRGAAGTGSQRQLSSTAGV